MADLKIVISALNKAGGDIAKLKGDIKGVGDAGTQAKGGVKGFSDGIGSVLSKAALAAGAVAAVGMAIKQVYEVTKEAAELDYARSKFDMLSESIGTTSTALLVDLRAATAGLVSDAELIDGAGQMMALGLATTHDEAVRLATVAGELGMNMNQLVLTLTNKTTMRFDTLGVSVAGFDEKVKALEATGMSADKAFSEAFLQQAEEQISKVGRVADSSVGSFKLMEAGIKNLGDAAKANLLDILEPALAGIAGYLSEQGNVAQAERAFKNLANSMDDALIPSTKFRQEVYKLTGPNGAIRPDKLGEFNELFEYYSNQVKIAEEGTQSWADANYDSAEGMAAAEAAALAQTLATEEMTEVAIAAAEAQAKLNAELANIKTVGGNYQGIIDLGYKYTDILKEITVQEKIMAEEPIGSEKYEEAKGKVKELQGAMDDLANRVTLDMFQATIAIGGVTEAELSAYMQMAIDMGFMSEEGAQAAMDAYGNAIATINGYEIDEKTGNVKVDAVSAFITLDLLQQYQLLDKEQRVYVKTYYGTTGNYDPYENYTGPGGAVGMAVNAGEPYIWQEYGYHGERFVPSADGYILSRSDAARAASGGGANAGEIAMAVKAGVLAALSSGGLARNYNLTMPTSSNPADVRTAFELMEAWA
jgi:tetratricopeptide (TPR) repeat protein